MTRIRLLVATHISKLLVTHISILQHPDSCIFVILPSMADSRLWQWKTRATKIRKQILVGANLDPLPKRTPLNPVLHKKRTYGGYTVESAAFEARPGSNGPRICGALTKRTHFQNTPSSPARL